MGGYRISRYGACFREWYYDRSFDPIWYYDQKFYNFHHQRHTRYGKLAGTASDRKAWALTKKKIENTWCQHEEV